MKIDKLEIVNFMGIEGAITMNEVPHIAALIGPNGMGKTTVMNAIRFGLTGAEPEGGKLINNNANQCNVTIGLTDGVSYDFTRIKDVEKPSKCLINGKATTQKSMNEKIESIIGIPIEKIKILASSDIVAAMKPQEFSSFILEYIPEKLALTDIMSLVPDSTIGMMDIMEANLPAEGIEIATINEFDSFCRYNRKELKDSIARKKALYDTKPKETPGDDKETLNERLKALSNAEAAYKVYLAQKDAYDRALNALKKHEEMIRSLKTEIESVPASRPDPAVLDALKKEGESLNETIRNTQTGINGAKSALLQLERTLESLEKSVCPISPLITCHTDKTVAKNEISESIEATKSGLVAMEEEISKTTAKYEAVKEKIANYNSNAGAYEKKLSLMKQLKTLEDNKPELPAMPDEIEEPDVSSAATQIKNALKVFDEYEEGIRLETQIKALENELSDYERLVKAVAEKGPIRNGVISRYLKVFEDICNERSAKVRPEITFEFISKDGVVVLMDNGKGVKLPYSSLSGGEKAYMLFILMDMLNSLVGTNLLLLDELSVIDTKCFDALLDIVLSYAGEYDHVFVAAVDHADTVDSVASHSIPLLSLEREALEVVA